MPDPDERAEPYAQLVNMGRFLVKRKSPGEFHAWLHGRMTMLAAAAGQRHIPTEMWMAALSVALFAVPDDKEWHELMGFDEEVDG